MDTSTDNGTSHDPALIVQLTDDQKLEAADTVAQIHAVTSAVFANAGSVERAEDPDTPNYWWWMTWVRDENADGRMNERENTWHAELQRRFGRLADRMSIGLLP